MKKLILLSVALASMLTSGASEVEYTFNFGHEQPFFYGTERLETYDIAICLDNKNLQGAKIKGVSVPLPGDPDLYNGLSAFLTKELKVERINGKRVNVPDICNVEATLENGILTATFDEPYQITDEPVHVGYSFNIATLEEVNKKPVAVVNGMDPNGFWFHSSKTSLSWTNYVDKSTEGLQSAMTVIIDGEFPKVSATVSLPSNYIISADSESEYSFSLINYGLLPIKSIDYSWTVDGKSGEGSCSLETPVENSLGSIGKVSIKFPRIETYGKYPMALTITKVNGIDNENSEASAEACVIYAPMKPVFLPLIEEYTGLWCQYCPSGYAVMEQMKEDYGYKFVGAAWHNRDDMTVTHNYPNTIPGYPTMFANRNIQCSARTTLSTWLECRELETIYAINCEIDFADDSHNLIKGTATVTPIDDVENVPSIGFLVVADGLNDPEWIQQNAYSGSVSGGLGQGMSEKWAEFFANSSFYVSDLTFNDVVIVPDYATGVENSLPAEVKPFETYEYSMNFDLSNVICSWTKKPVPFNPEKVRVIAFLLDKNGIVLNSCTSAYPGQPAPNVAVDMVNENLSVVSTMWYDLQGCQISNPDNGLYIRIDKMSDGSFKAHKTVIR